MIGISRTTSQAPWMNLVRAMSAMTMPAAAMPMPLVTALETQRGSSRRSRYQCITMPAWEMVKPVNTPRA